MREIITVNVPDGYEIDDATPHMMWNEVGSGGTQLIITQQLRKLPPPAVPVDVFDRCGVEKTIEAVRVFVSSGPCSLCKQVPGCEWSGSAMV